MQVAKSIVCVENKSIQPYVKSIILYLCQHIRKKNTNVYTRLLNG